MLDVLCYLCYNAKAPNVADMGVCLLLRNTDTLICDFYGSIKRGGNNHDQRRKDRYNAAVRTP